MVLAGACLNQNSVNSTLMQDVIVGERRFQYEADVKRDPLNYDSWFDYIRLEESAGQPDRVYLCTFRILQLVNRICSGQESTCF